jgi:quinol monooxygenase YgiN
MFTVRVALQVRSPDRERFVAQLQTERREVPGQFDGCERFDVCCDTEDPTRILLYEEWLSREAFDAYRTSDYFAAGGAVLFPLIDGEPASAYYESELVGP